MLILVCFCFRIWRVTRSIHTLTVQSATHLAYNARYNDASILYSPTCLQSRPMREPHLFHSHGVNNTKYARKTVVYWYFDNQVVLL